MPSEKITHSMKLSDNFFNIDTLKKYNSFFKGIKLISMKYNFFFNYCLVKYRIYFDTKNLDILKNTSQTSHEIYLK